MGQQGLDYLRTEFSMGGQLSKLVARHIPLDRGRVVTTTYSRADLPDNLDWGLDPAIAKLQWKLIEDKTIEFLRGDPNAVAVFEHPFATPTDRWISVKTVPYVYTESDVLFVVNSAWASQERVEQVLVEAGAQQEHGVLGRHQALAAGLSGTIALSVVEELVRTVEAIVVRAFDAEGYLLWLPEPVGPKPASP